MAKLNYIPDWQKKSLRCYFCEKTSSVKYSMEIVNPVISSKPTTVCVCNMCALKYGHHETVLQKEKRLTCPFCGGEVHIVVSDDEGNIHEEAGYEENPWSGLGYQIRHTREDVPEGVICPIATWPYEEQGTHIFDTREEIETLWNTRRA